jgi:hypothetical protein
MFSFPGFESPVWRSRMAILTASALKPVSFTLILPPSAFVWSVADFRHDFTLKYLLFLVSRFAIQLVPLVGDSSVSGFAATSSLLRSN